MHTFSDYFAAYWHTWLIEGIILIALLAFVQFNWKKISRMAASHMILSAVIIWLCGTVLYSIGFAYEGSGHSLTSYFFRAAQAALGMFISDNELVEVSSHYKESPLYMVLFSLTHISALFLSTIVVLNTIGFRLKNYFLLFVEKVKSKREDKDTYVLWGFGERTVTLAKDIRRKHPDARIIFLRSTDESNIGEKMDITGLLNFGSGSSKSFSIIKTIGSIDDALVAYISAENFENGLKLPILRKIFQNTTNISFISLMKDQGFNLKFGALIYHDKDLCYNPSKSIRIYTGASMSGKNRIMEEHILLERQNGNRAIWKFVDHSFLAMTSLKSRFELQPIHMLPSSCIENGTVNDTFSALILGFGSSGRSMFRYLYEFGSFIDRNGKPSGKNIVMVDKNMDKLAGSLCVTCPFALNTDNIKMISCEPGTVKFWEAMKENLKGINCISIALGNDEDDINMAIDIYRAVIQYSSKKPENVKIFLHIYSSENENSILKLAADYNKLKDETGIEIVPYGSISEVYTCDAIMATDLLKTARTFNYNFGLLRGENQDCTEDQAWARDYNLSEYINKYKATPLAIEEITRQIAQCNSDSLHIGTILSLAGIPVEDKESIAAFLEIFQSREPGTFKYKAATKEVQTLLDNLAHNAHSRLVASHWLLGYRYADEATVNKDPIEAARQKYTHNIRLWAECSTEEKLLAYSVVETSFNIAYRM